MATCSGASLRENGKRKATDRSPTALSRSSTVIAALAESRSREVCLCVMDTANYALNIFFLADGHSHNETIMTLQAIHPDHVGITTNAKDAVNASLQILLPDSSQTAALTRRISDCFRRNSTVTLVSRQYFDQDRGADWLTKVAFDRVDAELITKYTALSASYCLFRFVESAFGVSFADHSIRITFQSSFNGRMIIDRRTALSLELVACTSKGSQGRSLFDVINETQTTVGARLLRSEIVRPLADPDVASIVERLDAVELLTRKFNASATSKIADMLSAMPDLDKIPDIICAAPKTLSATTAKRGIEALLGIRACIQCSWSIWEQLSGDLSSASLLSKMCRNFKNDQLEAIFLKVGLLVSAQSNSFSSHKFHDMHHPECFAVNAGVDGLLDLARLTYLQSLEEIQKLAQCYTEEVGLPARVAFTAGRGFFLSFPQVLNNSNNLPDKFVRVVAHKRTLSCSTLEIQCLSDRALESINQALTCTNQLIESLLVDLRRDLGVLFPLVDSVALLDMLLSFSQSAKKSALVKPLVVEGSSLIVENGQHPILSSLTGHGFTAFIPNDTCMTATSTVCIVSGPNGSGKSIYIKQVALIVILAQIGCFVPATKAILSVRHRLCSRMGTTDDMESNLSSFALEMKEIGHILKNSSSNSLVLVDELGRGTSNHDGQSLAIALSEFVAKTGACCLFASHFETLPLLTELIGSVRVVHFGDLVYSHTPPNATTQSQFPSMHKLSGGPFKSSSEYGIVLAEESGFPTQITVMARRARHHLSHNDLAVKASPLLASQRALGSLIDRIGMIICVQSRCDIKSSLSKLKGIVVSSPAFLSVDELFL